MPANSTWRYQRQISYALTVQLERPNVLRRLIGSGEDISVGELDADEAVTFQSDVDRGLPSELERQLLQNFEFDGLFVEWPEKGHEVNMIGMQKFGDLLDDNDQPMYVIGQSDFREPSGFVFPHRIEYMNGAGRTLAIETIEAIEVVVTPFELEQETVAH